MPLPGPEELPGADEVKPLEQEPPPERTDSWQDLFTPTDRALWYERPTSQLLPGLVSMLYPFFVVLMPYLFRYAMLELEPSTTKSRVNLRLHWADSTPLPPGRPVAPQPLPAQLQPQQPVLPGRPVAPQLLPAQPQPQPQRRDPSAAAEGPPRPPQPRAVVGMAARPTAPGEGVGGAAQLSAPRFATPSSGTSGPHGGATPLATQSEVEARRQPRAAAPPGSGGGSSVAAAAAAPAGGAAATSAALAAAPLAAAVGLQRWLDAGKQLSAQQLALAAQQLGPAARLMLPPAWLRLLGAAPPSGGDDVAKSYSAGTYEGLVRAKNEVEANSNLLRFEGPQLFGKLGALLINVALFLWSWLKLLLLYMVEPLIHVMSHAVKLTEPLTKLKVFDKWTSETVTVLDEFQLLLKSSGANIGAFLMASELAKAFLVPVLVGFWPAVSMGQMTLAALDSAINR